jgi:hypothetical protein
VLLLGALGLILGMTGLLRVLALGRSRLLFPASGTVVAGVIVCAASLSPDLLGPVYQASRAKDPIDPTAIRVVPLPGQPVNTGPESPDWADASRAALQQGGLNVQVVSASVRRVGKKDPLAKKISPGDYHFIRLRTQQAEAAREPATKPHLTPGAPDEKDGPRLTDGAGKVYQLCDVQEIEAPKERRSLFPVDFQDQVLVFEAPARPADLRLELPAEAWGGKGTFRFTIPGAMIRDERPGATGPGGRR